jgi:hypothetical protein
VEFPGWLADGYRVVEQFLDAADEMRNVDGAEADGLLYRSLSEACRLLTQVIGLPVFGTDLNERAAFTASQRDTVRAITGDHDRFEAVLLIERRLLVQAGLTDQSAVRVVDQCRAAFDARRTRTEPTPDEVRVTLDRITRATCESAGSYERANSKHAREQSSRQLRRLRRLVFATVCGAVVIVANYSTLVLTGAIVVPGTTAVSDAIGTAAVGYGGIATGG